MLTNEGQTYFLNTVYRERSHEPKYVMLLNMEKPTKTSTLKTVDEAEGNGYKRVRLNPDEWGIPQINPLDAEIASKEVRFGPFSEEISVTHVALCSTESGTNGILYLFAPIQHFIDNSEARIFEPGDVFSVSIRDKLV